MDPSAVPLYEGREVVEEMYAQAQRDGTPFFGIEAYEHGYAVTYDLLPADSELAPPAHKEIEVRLTSEIEAIVGDESLPTVEVSKSVSDSLGNISFFEREESARRVAASVAGLVLDEANWVEMTPPDGAGQFRQND
jgi:hypothetical protein